MAKVSTYLNFSRTAFPGQARTDGHGCAESMGFKLTPGNSVYINQQPDTRSGTNHLFKLLSDGGKVETPLQEMFWDGYFGSLADKFGVQWMFNCESKT